MTIDIWLETSHHAAFRVGGWAWVRRAGAETTGMAGGARQTTVDANALSALIAACRNLPSSAQATVRASRPEILACAPHLAGTAAKPPENDLALWAELQKAVAGRRVSILAAKADPKTPGAFAAAWAELARYKAKSAGPFASAIPKTNLVKSGA